MKISKFFVIPAVLLLAGVAAAVAAPMRYLHVRVNNIDSKELVRINVPLMLAEKIIPAINHGKLHNGKVECNGFHANDVDLKAILEALKSAPEGEFVTVQGNDQDVRVAKEHGQLVVHVRDSKNSRKRENVDVTIPWSVAQALASDTSENELNVEAAIKALEAEPGDVTLVAVSDTNETVRIWIDSNSTAE
jgi:ribonuclease HI